MLVSLVVRRCVQPHSPGHEAYLSSPKRLITVDHVVGIGAECRKNGLSPAPWLLDQGEVTLRPPPPPEAYGVGVQLHDGPRGDVGRVGVFVKQEGESCPLVLRPRDRPPTDNTAALFEKLGAKLRMNQPGRASPVASPSPTRRRG